jgi:fido (protein-threonine AMPylation protein)
MSPGSESEISGAYQPFPPFHARAGLSVPSGWDQYSDLLESTRVRRNPSDVAAVNDGLRLASLDATTMSYVDPLDDAPRSPLAPYNLVLQAAAGRGVGEGFIRALHAELCGSQFTYESRTSEGVTLRPLPPGQYKVEPTDLRRPDGSAMVCAPVEETGQEVARLANELTTEQFAAAHPVLQAAYALAALLVIHPFPDGNGRVARALASVYLEQTLSLPLLVLPGHYEGYVLALDATHGGAGGEVVDFVYERAIDAIMLACDSLETLRARSPEAALAGLADGPRVDDGPTTESLVHILRTLALQSLTGLIASMELPGALQWQVESPRSGANELVLSMVLPGERRREAIARIEVVAGANPSEGLVLVSSKGRPSLQVRRTEIVPTASPALAIRLHMWARQLVGEVLHSLEGPA